MQQKELRINSGKSMTTPQLIISLIVWVYIIYRAVLFEITQDEAYSYFLVKTNYWKALPGTYNTHWLNTLSTKIFLLLPGEDNVWKLRMLSILSWPVFALSIIKLCRRFDNRIIGWLFFFVCILNPYLVLYFSLERGYAVACALLVFSLWQTGKLIDLQEIHPQKWMRVFLPAALSVLGNFSLLYFFIGLVAVYMDHLIRIGKWRLLMTRSSFRLTSCNSNHPFCSIFFVIYKILYKRT